MTLEECYLSILKNSNSCIGIQRKVIWLGLTGKNEI